MNQYEKQFVCGRASEKIQENSNMLQERLGFHVIDSSFMSDAQIKYNTLQYIVSKLCTGAIFIGIFILYKCVVFNLFCVAAQTDSNQVLEKE